MRSAVDRGVFTEHIVVADLECGGFSDVFQVLGFAADAGEGEEFVAFAKRGMALEHHMRVKHAVITEFDMRADDAKGADPDICANFGIGRDDSSGMDHRGNVIQTRKS